jgi:tetratricopeptide (TPR) repeat protein
MRLFIFIFFFVSVSISYSQGNCNAFLWQKDTLKYKACQLIENNQDKFYQFDSRFHKLMNEALEICPYYAYPYRELAAPYVKSGNFLMWKKYIDKAVKYEPKDYLSVRASLRFKFFADFKGAIKDIDSLSSIVSYDIGYSSNGTYHLNVVKGLCLKSLGRTDEAIAIIAKQSEIEDDFGMYNYLHLGVLYMEKEDCKNALDSFEKQSNINNLAENQYYAALSNKNLNNLTKALSFLKEALKLYRSEQRMFDPYNELIDQIYMSDITREIKSIEENIK